jgi:hypothetical protein
VNAPLNEPLISLVKPIAVAFQDYIVIAKMEPSELYGFANKQLFSIPGNIGDLKVPTLVAVPDGVLIFNFGDIWSYDPVQQNLLQVNYNGELPRRRGMSGVVFERRVYLF